jgi:hypothetical protein
MFNILLNLKPIIKWSNPPRKMVPINAKDQKVIGQLWPIRAIDNTATNEIKKEAFRTFLFLFNHL